MTRDEIRHYKNLGAESERAVIRRIIRKLKVDLETVLAKLDKHVAAVSERKGGLGRK